MKDLLTTLKSLWVWFLDGLTGAVIAGLDVLKSRRMIRIALESKPPSIRDLQDKELGQILLNAQPPRIEPATLYEQLAGSFIDVDVPTSSVIHRDLNPIALESEPFLQVFAKHQIERVTPWKSKDTYYGVTTSRLPEKPPRLAVRIHVVPRLLLKDALSLIEDLKGSRLRLLLPGDPESARIIVPLDDGLTQERQVKKIVQALVLVSFALIGVQLAFLSWQILSLDSETAALEDSIAQQKSALRPPDSGTADALSETGLFAMRGSRPLVVETLEALSVALPDDAYLTSFQFTGGQLSISGISTRTSALVPALEQSGHFKDVSFSAATTRLLDGSANRFHLSMDVIEPERAAQP